MTPGQDSLGDRMKRAEDAQRLTLPPRMPVIVRADGKAFHSVLRHAERPWDTSVEGAMDAAALDLCEEIQGAALAHIQSDEISVLVHPYRTHASQPWLAGGVQKIASVSASIATRGFRAYFRETDIFASALFDARVFVMPETDVCNYFLWRQQDATRNSVQMLARAHFSDRECHKKSCAELREMLIAAKGVDWSDTATSRKRGRCAVRETYEVEGAARARWVIDNEIPVFSEDRRYVERLLTVEDES